MPSANLATATRLPIRRAFVLQIHADIDITQGHLSGRVEHILSGQAGKFSDLEQLLAFITHQLTNHDSNSPACEHSS